jgi:DNA-binding winged helix-turn-helix (wHTH) protein/TolB-like protein
MKELKQQTYSFSEFTLDLKRGCLLRGNEEIKLRPKSFDTLRHLVENSGRLISKDELMGAVWPDTSVTDDSLVQCLIDIRRALGEDGQRLIKTIPRRGYLFDSEVRQNDLRPQVYDHEIDEIRVTIAEQPVVTSSRRGRAVQLAAIVVSLSVLAAVIWLLRRERTQSSIPIKTLAVLPFRSQTSAAQDDYLGLGIANEIITKVSQGGALTVRPTSAVRKYTNTEVGALQAARELQVDAVLDGTYLRVGDRLRVTVNLLRVTDGSSLWAEKFDQPFTDVFTIQDQVSQQVAQRVWPKLSTTQQERINKHSTANALALSYYAKGMYHLYNIRPDKRTRSDSTLAVDLFKKAIELDSEYALAHAQLGNTYARIAVFQEDSPELIERAKQELGVAEKIDPQLSEVHLVRFYIYFSQYEGWSVERAMRELRIAQQLDPNVGHAELMDLYSHIGLEDLIAKEFEAVLQLDPGNEEAKSTFVNSFLIAGKADEALEASHKFFNREPDIRYLIEKKMVKEAEALATEEHQRDPEAVWEFVYQVLVMALQGKHKEAQAAVPVIISKERRYRGYHHDTYNIARIYALAGESEEALKWLRITVSQGYTHYPFFARDPFLDPIRKDTAFKEFLEEQRQRWEGYKREFS